MIIKLFIFILPWPLKRYFLERFFSYELDPLSKIGFAWVFPKKLIMRKGATIDHLTVAIHLDYIELRENSSVGRSNWITGFPSGSDSKHFAHQKERQSSLILGRESAITKHHHLDCTNTIEIGDFSTIAGYYSQLLTHSINFKKNIQDSLPIIIGNYTFVGTNSVILGGAQLPSFSVLGAKSLLNKNFEDEWSLYAGIPAKKISNIPQDYRYFDRTEGFVF